jgi:hypothetical protein
MTHREQIADSIAELLRSYDDIVHEYDYNFPHTYPPAALAAMRDIQVMIGTLERELREMREVP